MVVDISTAQGAHQDSGTLSGGRQHASGTGRSDGHTGGHAGSGSFNGRPRFDAPVASNGYRWWYVDATSDDGVFGLTVIGFVGSVFSPYYARARKHGLVDPENHCAINVALYGPVRRWAMTERGPSSLHRTADLFQLSHSSMAWKDNQLIIDINERCVPFPFPLRGQVIVTPDVIYDEPVALDDAGKHQWRAVAPKTAVQVAFDRPRLSWSGTAYYDVNWGEEPLETGFKNWTWLRTTGGQATDVVYDVERRDGSRFSFGRRFAGGTVSERAVPQRHFLQRGFWGMTREVRSDQTPRLIATLEDAPFYTRNHIRLGIGGETREAFHESLSLDRFISPITQLMLPFRMPRRG
jgi:carotenoid 1,2-hydratase